MTKETFGEYLRRERELRGISLETIAEETKISVSILAAIEAEDWKKLPAQVFVRGFIRNYAQVIGLDPNEVILRYETMANPPKEEEEEDYIVQVSGSGEEEQISLGAKSKKWLWVLALVVILAVAVAFGLKLWQSKKMEAIVPEATSSQIPQDFETGMINQPPPGLVDPPQELLNLPEIGLPLIKELNVPEFKACNPEGVTGVSCQVSDASDQ
ncbi:helix-turn-helix domain-containing protein [Thermosulfuriphilus sp.]